MKKLFTDTRAWRYVKTLLEILLIAAVIYGLVSLYISLGLSEARADDYDDVVTGYVLCADFVYVRPFPNRKGEPLGRLEPGDHVYLDGKKKNGYMHCVDLHMESGEGWVYKGYIVYDEPTKVSQSAVIVSKGRLAARKYVNGKRTRWLKPLASVKVYYWSDEWCVTNCGYVQTKYLELEGE